MFLLSAATLTALILSGNAFATPLPRLDALPVPGPPLDAPVIDGFAEEAAWSVALALPEPTVYLPTPDAPSVGSVKTLVVADAEALYVFFSVSDPEPGLVRAGLGRRDSRDDDMVGLLLDPSGDGRRGYLFLSTPIGVQLDALHLPGSGGDDWSWDAVWRSAGRRTEDGYEVEIAIPWAALGMSGEVAHFGLLSTRTVARKGQRYGWPAVEAGTDPLLAVARIEGPGALPERALGRRLGVELLPEVTAGYGSERSDSGRLTFAGVSPGLTARYAPGPGLGLVGTFNPDFSQLESDATQIDTNQRYALSYDEKRPFFLDGQDWFDHPVGGLVYTRSMNAPLYGFRGHLERGRLGVAALQVLDQAPPPTVNEGGGWTEEDLSGRSAMETLLRTRVSLGGDSYVGFLASDRTILDGDGAGDGDGETGPDGLWNRVGGVDTVIRLGKRATVEAALFGSATTFPTHDTPDLPIDELVAPPVSEPVLAPAAHLGQLWSGEKLFFHSVLTAVAPGFRQENGFMPKSDIVGGLTEDHYNLHPDLEWLPEVSIEAIDVWSYWRLSDQAPRERAYDPSVWLQFGNGAFLKVDERIAGEDYLGTWIPFHNTELYVESSFGEWLRGEAGTTLGTAPYYDASDPRAGNIEVGWVYLEIQPVSRFTLSLSPEVVRMTELDEAPGSGEAGSGEAGSGDTLFVAWTGRVKAELFLSRTVWLRALYSQSGGGLPEGGIGTGAWSVEPVAAWEWTPGRAVYVGGAYGVEDGDGGMDAYWRAFGKVGWVFGV